MASPRAFRHNSGQSLVQVMVGLAIASVMFAAFTTMTVNQNRETRGLTEKLAALDLQRTLTAMLGVSSTCGALFAPGNLKSSTVMPFDGSGVNASSPYVISLRTVPSGGTNPPLIAEGQAASPLSTSLKVASENGIQILVKSLVPPSAALKIKFDASEMVRALPDLQFPLALTISGPATSTTITGCAGEGGGAPSPTGNCGSFGNYSLCNKSVGMVAIYQCVNGSWKLMDFHPIYGMGGPGITGEVTCPF